MIIDYDVHIIPQESQGVKFFISMIYNMKYRKLKAERNTKNSAFISCAHLVFSRGFLTHNSGLSLIVIRPESSSGLSFLSVISILEAYQ
jgi:hypothetical protein